MNGRLGQPGRSPQALKGLGRRCLLFAILILPLGGLGQPAFAPEDDRTRTGAKTPGEQWLDAHRDPHQKRYFGQPIDLSLRDADLVETLVSFAELGRFNLLVQPGVQGKVTVELKQIPWDQALEQILKLHGLGMELTGGEVHVDRRTGSRRQKTGFDLVTVRLKPIYGDPAIIAQALNQPAAGVPGPGGSIWFDGRSLAIRDTRSGLLDFARVLSYIDVPMAADESSEELARRCALTWNRHVPERLISHP